ncbi:MAG: VOC family protein [Bryobacterales bacterium]|nr:VOC family protein [Bryobacterales bacterium]
MHRILPAILTSCLALALAAPASAQLLAARESPFAVGHHHLNVTDVEAHKRFWADLLGGTMAKFGKTEVVKLPNTLLFLREQAPTGESNGSTVNHLGFKVPDLHGLVPRLKAAGIEMVTTEVVAGATSDVHHNTSQDVYMAFAKGPDGVRVELMENKELDGIDSHHIHIFTADDEATQAWYVKHFGGKPGTRGPFRKADVPGIELTFAVAGDPVEPTKGRVVDHIGFEVDDLESFCQKLAADGVKFDVPFRKIESIGLSVAFLTDPWGTYIELTEGLDKF